MELTHRCVENVKQGSEDGGRWYAEQVKNHL